MLDLQRSIHSATKREARARKIIEFLASSPGFHSALAVQRVVRGDYYTVLELLDRLQQLRRVKVAFQGAHPRYALDPNPRATRSPGLPMWFLRMRNLAAGLPPAAVPVKVKEKPHAGSICYLPLQSTPEGMPIVMASV